MNQAITAENFVWKERRKTVVEKAKELLNELKELEEKYGSILTRTQACHILGISKNRLSQCIAEGIIQEIYYYGRGYIPEKEVIKYIDEHLSNGGRPKISSVQLFFDAFKE